MANNELTYNDFLQLLNIQELLVDVGYQLNKRDGLRYPSYVKLDSHGQRVRGDKFIVTGNGKCCFQPPEQKNYNVIGFIKEHPTLFDDYKPGMSLDRLVNVVCNRLLNNPIDVRESRVAEPKRDAKPFNLSDYGKTATQAQIIIHFFIYISLSFFCYLLSIQLSQAKN